MPALENMLSFLFQPWLDGHYAFAGDTQAPQATG